MVEKEWMNVHRAIVENKKKKRNHDLHVNEHMMKEASYCTKKGCIGLDTAEEVAEKMHELEQRFPTVIDRF
jgi:hypothetical protein